MHTEWSGGKQCIVQNAERRAGDVRFGGRNISWVFSGLTSGRLRSRRQCCATGRLFHPLPRVVSNTLAGRTCRGQSQRSSPGDGSGGEADAGCGAHAAVDAIALSVSGEAGWWRWTNRGRALTPIVTHQDRRSVAEAREIEKRVGRTRHLRIAGNLPFPGSISSTTYAWYKRHQPAVMRRADLVGHLNTFLHRQIMGGAGHRSIQRIIYGFVPNSRSWGWSRGAL